MNKKSLTTIDQVMEIQFNLDTQKILKNEQDGPKAADAMIEPILDHQGEIKGFGHTDKIYYLEQDHFGLEPAETPERDSHYVLTPGQKAIAANRKQDYGPPEDCHANIGAVWGAILQQVGYVAGKPIKPEDVALMMAGLKIIRAGTQCGGIQQDAYEDAHIYLAFAEDFRRIRLTRKE